MVTSLLGAIFAVGGFSIAIQQWPKEFMENKKAFYTNIFLIIALTFAGYHYQKNQILRQNRLLNEYEEA